jgi:predicted phosphodiesterase
LWPAEAWELLQEHSFPTVRGNHDREIAIEYDRLSPAGQFAHRALTERDRLGLAALPATVRVSPEILAVHGTPQDDNTYLLEELLDGRQVTASRATVSARLAGLPEGAEVVLCGHSHTQGFRQVESGPLVLNPGSVGCPVMADRPTARTLEYRSPHARYAILSRRNRRWAAEMMALEYDWDAAAQRALENGRPDWAQAMATGAVFRA